MSWRTGLSRKSGSFKRWSSRIGEWNLASVDRSALDQYLLWVTCRMIARDNALSGSEQFERYSAVYRLISEPIDKAAPAAE